MRDRLFDIQKKKAARRAVVWRPGRTGTGSCDLPAESVWGPTLPPHPIRDIIGNIGLYWLLGHHCACPWSGTMPALMISFSVLYNPYLTDTISPTGHMEDAVRIIDYVFSRNAFITDHNYL